MRNRKTKWVVTIIALIIFLLVGLYIPAEPLNFRAMVVGIGIDLATNHSLRVSAQILTTSISDASSAKSSSKVVTVERETLTGALIEMSKLTSNTITLTHCNVVMLGESLIKSPYYYNCLNYIIINNYLSSHALIFGTKGSAEDILSSKVGFGNNASVYAQRIISEFGDFNTMHLKTIHELFIDYHQKGSAVWIPVIERFVSPPEIPSSRSDSPSSSQSESEYLFNIQQVAMFKKDTYLGIYGADCTSALNYVIHTIKSSSLLCKGDNDEDICFFILNTNTNCKYDWDAKTAKCKIELRAMLKEIVSYSTNNPRIDCRSVTRSEIERAEMEIVLQIEAFYEILQALDLDIYAFEEGFYAQEKTKVQNFSITDITFNVEVKIILD